MSTLYLVEEIAEKILGTIFCAILYVHKCYIDIFEFFFKYIELALQSS